MFSVLSKTMPYRKGNHAFLKTFIYQFTENVDASETPPRAERAPLLCTMVLVPAFVSSTIEPKLEAESSNTGMHQTPRCKRTCATGQRLAGKTTASIVLDLLVQLFPNNIHNDGESEEEGEL